MLAAIFWCEYPLHALFNDLSLHIMDLKRVMCITEAIADIKLSRRDNRIFQLLIH